MQLGLLSRTPRGALPPRPPTTMSASPINPSTGKNKRSSGDEK
jgi:hypothetical protein